MAKDERKIEPCPRCKRDNLVHPTVERCHACGFNFVSHAKRQAEAKAREEVAKAPPKARDRKVRGGRPAAPVSPPQEEGDQQEG